MPVNKKGGKNFKKAKKNSFQTPTFEAAIEGQLYAKIIKKFGDRRFSIVLHGTGEEVIGRARGSLVGWHNMKKDDIILVSTRDFRNSTDEVFVQDTYDIIKFYLADHVRKLIKMGELTDSSFTDQYINNFDYTNDADEEEDEVGQQREYEIPDSESEEEEVDIEDI